MRTRWRRPLTIAVAVLLVAGACSGGHSRAASSRTGATRARRAATARARDGGVLRLGMVTPTSLDPAQARSPSEVLAADLLFDTLTAFDPVARDVRPAIASRWQPSPDQRHWDFVIRPGARFGNGRPITSADVKYSLERLARKGSGAPELVVGQLEPIAGFRGFRVDGTAPTLAGVTTPAPDVVHFDLDTPLSSLPVLLCHPVFGIVPREAVERPSPPFGEQPVGSGSFAFRSRSGDVIHLVRAVGSHSHVDGVDLVLEADAAASYAAFRAGAVDWTLVPPERADDAASRFGRGGFAPYLAVLFYGFNLKSPKFADPRFREAILHAIDRQAITGVVYGDTVRGLDGAVARGVPGFQSDPCGTKCAHDPARARALVSEAFPDGKVPEVEIDFDDDDTQEAIAKAMQANLRAVGIPAGLRPHPFDQYAQLVDRGQEELFRLGWIGVYPAADNFLTPLFLTGNDTNVTGFSNGTIDDLLKTGRQEPDPAKRLGLYQDAERRIMDMVPIIPIAQFQTQSVIGERVAGLVVNPLGTFDASAVWLTG